MFVIFDLQIPAIFYLHTKFKTRR